MDAEIVRATFHLPQDLPHRLKVQAAKEQTSVSRTLCSAAEVYLATEGHRRTPAPAKATALRPRIAASPSAVRSRRRSA